ncbi:MAG: hypothetical protein ACOC33_00360 [bacterium]
MKDYKAISELYDENHKYEFLIRSKLQKNMPKWFIEHGYEFQHNKNNYDKYDLEFIKYNSNREIIKVCDIELEIGNNQNFWNKETNVLRSKWPRGISLLDRKKYGLNFQIFMKFSTTLKSSIIIDVRDNFIYSNNFKTSNENHNLDFETNNRFISIPWNFIDNNLFKIKNSGKKISNKKILLIENDEYSLFYIFLYFHFIKNK